MSIHPSLGGSSTLKKQRSVLKRLERIKKMSEIGKWSDDSSAFKLPKTKIVRIKLKKTKSAPDKAAEGAGKTAAKK